MKVLEQVDRVPEEFAGATLALGNFDGVHRGHQKVIGEAIARTSREESVSSLFY